MTLIALHGEKEEMLKGISSTANESSSRQILRFCNGNGIKVDRKGFAVDAVAKMDRGSSFFRYSSAAIYLVVTTGVKRVRWSV